MATVTTHCKVVMVLTPVHVSTQDSTSATTPEAKVHHDVAQRNMPLLFLKCWKEQPPPLAEAGGALGIMAGDLGLPP